MMTMHQARAVRRSADDDVPEAGDEVAAYEPAADAPARSGFTRFFTREWPRLRLYLRRMVGDEEAEDMAQEAFARLLSVKENVRSQSGLLYHAARNLVVDRQRRNARARAVMVEDEAPESVADPAPSPEDAAHWRLRLERANAALDRMSDKCRRVFLLRVVDGCSYREIAERVGISELAVEKQLQRAFEICAAWR